MKIRTHVRVVVAWATLHTRACGKIKHMIGLFNSNITAFTEFCFPNNGGSKGWRSPSLRKSRIRSFQSRVAVWISEIISLRNIGIFHDCFIFQRNSNKFSAIKLCNLLPASAAARKYSINKTTSGVFIISVPLKFNEIKVFLCCFSKFQ